MQQNRKPAATQDRGITVTIDINPTTFNATKKAPLLDSGFRIYRLDEKIVVEKVNGPRDAKPQRYTLEEGKLNLVIKPNATYAFFRSAKFQGFLDIYGISRVRSIDPNGEYQGRSGQFKNNIDSFTIITDGTNVVNDSSSLHGDEEPIFSVRFASSFATVKGASFVLVQQTTVKQSDESKEVTFKLRELITSGDIYALEETLLGKAAELDAVISDLLV